MSATDGPAVAEIVAVHRVSRREFAVLPALVRGVADSDADRAAVVARHARMMLRGLRTHDNGEDGALWPPLLNRAPEAAGLLARLRAQHEAIAVLVEHLHTLLDAWDPGGSAEAREPVASAASALYPLLAMHLDAEDAQVLPLVEAHLTGAEWDAVTRPSRGVIPRQQTPLMFGAVLEEATDAERELLLAPVPLPLRFLLRTVGARKYRQYAAELRAESPPQE
jgi:hemerythrin-like domain-containing protein